MDKNLKTTVLYSYGGDQIDYFLEACKKNLTGAKILIRFLQANELTRTIVEVTENTKTGFFDLIKKERVVQLKPQHSRPYDTFRTICKISYTNKGFFCTMDGKTSLLKINHLSLLPNKAENFFTDKCPRFKFIPERKNLIPNITFATIERHKLYSIAKIAKHYYGFHSKKVNLFLMKTFFSHNAFGLGKLIHPSKIKQTKWFFRNIENVFDPSCVVHDFFFNQKSLEHSQCQIIYDTMMMCYTIKKPFNFGWSYNRIKEEHDKASQQISKAFIGLPNDPLSISVVFMPFIEHVSEHCPEMTLITDSGRLVAEGATLRHCVGTYVNRVNSGDCIILNYKGENTLEVKLRQYSYELSQLYTYGNTAPSHEIQKEVADIVNEVNKVHFPESKSNSTKKAVVVDDDYPF